MDIRKEFLKRGFLLSPRLEEKIKEDEIEKIISKLDENTTIVTDDLYCMLKGKGVEVVKEYKKGEEKKRINAFVDFYNKRFEFLRSLLEEKVDTGKITSINKVSYGEATVIGMVRETSKGEFVLEDSTGSIECVYDNKVLDDEVVAVEGKKTKNKFLVERIIYPDVPLSKKVNTTEEDCHVLFTSKFREEKLSRDSIKLSHVPYIFTFDLREDEVKEPSYWLVAPKEKIKKPTNRKIGVRLPSVLRIEGINFMVFSFNNMDEIKSKLDIEDEKKLMISLLRRRHLSPFEYMEGDPYLLKDLPDVIFFTGGKESFFFNYKGISLISVSDEKDFILNLKTREFEESG